MVIETERLILREMTEQDFDALFNVWGDPENMCHYSCVFDEELVKLWICRNMENTRIYGFGLWVVCLKDTGEAIGTCGLTLQRINKKIKPEIGYHLRLDQHGKGYAKEAAIAVRDWTFRNTPFRMIYSYMTGDNEPSIRTAMAYGCRFVEEYVDEDNELTKVYAISRDTWLQL